VLVEMMRTEQHAPHTPSATDEPQLQPPASPGEKRIHDAIERAASIGMSLVAAVLLLLVAVTLVEAVREVWLPLTQHDYMRAALEGLDSTFLAIILLELVHTTLLRGPLALQLQEFLVIGIMSVIRSALEVVAGSRAHAPREVAIDLVITGAAVLLMVMALWLLRHRLYVDRATDHAARHHHHHGKSR
jgi:phosphate starvation-inducible membrane PsiE